MSVLAEHASNRVWLESSFVGCPVDATADFEPRRMPEPSEVSESLSAIGEADLRAEMTSNWFSAARGKLKPENGEKIEYAAIKRNGNVWGRVIVRVDKRYSEEPNGRSFAGTFVGASSKEARAWFSKEKKANNTFMLHLCRGDCTDCEQTDKSVTHLVHKDTWRLVSNNRAYHKHKTWRANFSFGADAKSASTAEPAEER